MKSVTILLGLVIAGPALAQDAATISSDRRTAVVQICTAEAQRRGTAMGATDVSLRELEDTDVKSSGRASMRAEMTVVSTDSKGKMKSKKYDISCSVRDNVITEFKVR